MNVIICECKHCGTEYRFQASGNYESLDTPREFQSPDYCPECQEAIVTALSKITKKYSDEYVETDEVTLEMLKKYEVENFQEEIQTIKNSKYPIFPKSKRVFATLYDTVNKECGVCEAVIGRGEFSGRQYIYRYYPSKISEAKVLVKKRVEIATGREIRYVLTKI